jgi:hypothetical protein
MAGHAGPVSAATIARQLDLPRSTTYHLLAELEQTRFVTRLPAERRYGLGIAAFELGSAYLRHDPLERLARPLLRVLVERVGHSARSSLTCPPRRFAPCFPPRRHSCAAPNADPPPSRSCAAPSPRSAAMAGPAKTGT